MSGSLVLTSFAPDAIIRHDFVDTFPEFYQLQDVVESHDWHDHQSVFDHSIKSAQALESIVSFNYLNTEQRDALTAYLNSVFDVHTRLDLLRLATLLHDIGKLISFQTNSQDKTSNPGHGFVGGWIAGPFVDRFDLTAKEKVFVLGLIADHLTPSDLIELSVNNQTDHQQIVEILQQQRPDSALELLLLGYSDWMGCDVREVVHAERDRRVGVVHKCLASIIVRLEK